MPAPTKFCSYDELSGAMSFYSCKWVWKKKKSLVIPTVTMAFGTINNFPNKTELLLRQKNKMTLSK